MPRPAAGAVLALLLLTACAPPPAPGRPGAVPAAATLRLPPPPGGPRRNAFSLPPLAGAAAHGPRPVAGGSGLTPRPVILLGTSASAVEALLGPPDLARREGAARFWRYRAAGCTLAVFLYGGDDGGPPRVAHLDARGLGVRRVTPAACLARLAGA